MTPRQRMSIAAAVLMAVCSSTALLGTALAVGGEDPVVVAVGDSTLTASQLTARLRAMPRFQLETFGKTPAEIRRAVLDTVVVPELLWAAEAKRRRLQDSPAVRDRLRLVHARALEDQLTAEVHAKQPVSEAEVSAYFEAERARFEIPRRIRIWRLLLPDEATAQGAIRAASGSDGIANWSKLARERSLDKATAMRHGDLGFVRPDGQTDVPRVRVDPALFAAADRVKDGEVVADPVAEGERFAAVWRRGSLPAVERTLAGERATIRELLLRERVEQARQRLIDELRARHLRELGSAPLELLELDAFGSEAERRRPGTPPKVLLKPPPVPSASDQGLR